ncbi:hypothetical protein BDW67DRAFT_186239 [Aspergillus spinulosporus]
MRSYKNIVLIGVRRLPQSSGMPGQKPDLTDHHDTDSLGRVFLNSLLSGAALKVTVFARESSRGRTNIPSASGLITIADSCPQKDLVRAFQGQDALVNAITSFSIAEQLEFVDAVVAVAVKRYIPSKYGLDNNKPAA